MNKTPRTPKDNGTLIGTRNFTHCPVDSPEAKPRSSKASSREPGGYSGLSTGSSHVAKRRLRLQKSCSQLVASLGANRKPIGRVTPGMKWLYQCIVRTCTIIHVGKARQGKARQGKIRRGSSNQANEKVNFTLCSFRRLHRIIEARGKGEFTSWHGSGSNFTASVGSTVQNSQSTMTTLKSWCRPPHPFKQKWKEELVIDILHFLGSARREA